MLHKRELQFLFSKNVTFWHLCVERNSQMTEQRANRRAAALFWLCLCLLCDFGQVAFSLWASVTLSEMRNRPTCKVPSKLDILQLPTLGIVLEAPLERGSCCELPRQRKVGMEFILINIKSYTDRSDKYVQSLGQQAWVSSFPAKT